MENKRMHTFAAYCQCLTDKEMMPRALRVAAIVGTALFAINHGEALLSGEMTTSRWISALLSYLVPYAVNIHGRFASRRKSAD